MKERAVGRNRARNIPVECGSWLALSFEGLPLFAARARPGVLPAHATCAAVGARGDCGMEALSPTAEARALRPAKSPTVKWALALAILLARRGHYRSSGVRLDDFCWSESGLLGFIATIS